MGTHHVRVTNIGRAGQQILLDGAPLEAPEGTMQFTGPGGALLELQMKECTSATPMLALRVNPFFGILRLPLEHTTCLSQMWGLMGNRYSSMATKCMDLQHRLTSLVPVAASCNCNRVVSRGCYLLMVSPWSLQLQRT